MKLTERQARSLGPQRKRSIEQADVKCWAGDAMGGDTVFCGVEKHSLRASDEGTSVMRYCCGDYTQCPSWRAEVDSRVSERTNGDA